MNSRFFRMPEISRERLGLALALTAMAGVGVAAQQKAPPTPAARVEAAMGGLALRSIGPALTSGRVADIAVDPTDHRIWYVGAAAGGVWKTTNAGISYTPVFDGQGSFSIGAITIDPKNAAVVWVGTGENNAQRVVAYGDGLYKSIDGGRSWKNVGLKRSEHISRIEIDPRNSDVVYVAAQGPLWSKGGDRGLYKTTDGGATWERVLSVDDWTGVNDVTLDPRDPDTLVATTWQRVRRTHGYVGGGPGSGVRRSTDGGKTWTKAQSGFPDVDLGRIGLARSPADPDVIYAIAEAAEGKGGFFRSRDGGASWTKMSGYQSGGNYYNEIFADPKDVDRVYAADTILQVTENGGKSFGRVGEQRKHVDNHSVWIDPADTDHLIVGCDGGVYETFDRGGTWRFMANLPITQYYRAATDTTKPFYRIYGGAQDNFSVGGPSRTRTQHGITNADWFITSGGDGFGSVIDPEDPNTVYAQSQFGSLSRFNLATGEVAGIQPMTDLGAAVRWPWDTPLIISPHSHTRLYFGASQLFRSDDRGDSWRAISPDLSRGIDRNKLPLFDRVAGVDAVAKNASTTLYGIALAVTESPIKAGLIAVGMDDGRINVTENGGAAWRHVDAFPGVPDRTPVFELLASQHDAGVLYAAFNNHQAGDFKPYVLKSADGGRTWQSITGNLPERGSVYALAEDHVDRNLLFAGTEFGLFVTLDGGTKWTRLSNGLPTIQVRDLAIQKAANDLVLATFGRGFYILDDYSPLRGLAGAPMAGDAYVFPVAPAPLYIQSAPLGLPGVAFQGHNYFSAPNPPYGAVFTYLLKDDLQSRQDRRHEQERAAAARGEDVFYPPWESLKAEDREEPPAVLVTISDSAGKPLRRFPAPASAGLHRVAWDLRLPPPDPITGPAYQPDPDFPFSSPPIGPLVVPGTYTVALSTLVDGQLKAIGAPRQFEVYGLDGAGTRTAETMAEEQQFAALSRSVLGTAAVIDEALSQLPLLQRAIDATPTAAPALVAQARQVETKLRDLRERLAGDPTLARRNEATPLSLLDRLNGTMGSSWSSTLEPPTPQARAQLQIVGTAYGSIVEDLRRLLDTDLRQLEDAAEAAGVPWTPGRFPRVPR